MIIWWLLPIFTNWSRKSLKCNISRKIHFGAIVAFESLLQIQFSFKRYWYWFSAIGDNWWCHDEVKWHFSFESTCAEETLRKILSQKFNSSAALVLVNKYLSTVLFKLKGFWIWFLALLPCKILPYACWVVHLIFLRIQKTKVLEFFLSFF